MPTRLLFIGLVWPEVRSSGAGIRTLALVEQALHAGYEVHFAGPPKETVFTGEMRELGVMTHFVQPNDLSFDSWISELKPQIAILDRFVIEEQFGWRIREHSPDTAIVLDTIDLHSLRRAREIEIKRFPLILVAPGTTDPDRCIQTLGLAREDAHRELSSILRCDLTLKISMPELVLLRLLGVPSSKLLYLPFSYRDECWDVEISSFESRKNFVSIGNFRHGPNLDSVRLLIEKLWPEIRRRHPGAELHLYGAYPPKEIMARSGRVPGLRVFGSCDHAISTLRQYRVLLAPLRFGAGLKGKISDAWIAGTPVCTTSIGAEGMVDERGEFPGALADHPDDFVSRASELYGMAEAWTGFQKRADLHSRNQFSWGKNARVFIQAMENLHQNLTEQRASDFLRGAFLQQSASASKYLSKWIEIKNRLEAKG